MGMIKRERMERLLPLGVPRWIRCYDNGGKTFDRYTVVYTHLQGKSDGYVWGRGMSEHPSDPQGFGQWFEERFQVDRPKYSHLGKKIKFTNLPVDCQKVVLDDYHAIWGL